MLSKSRRLSSLLAAVSATSLYMALSAGAHAQDQGTSSGTQSPPPEIVVTGSRIVRRDYSAQSPIVTLNQEQLQTTASVGVEQALAKLPQFLPGANQITGSFNVQSTALSTPGSSTLNLRGLGTNRNLVLVDGRRAQPIDATLDIDINTIPDAAIDSIETITGGAASTYGSDAISGVVNFKLKQNFQGLELDGQWGEADPGDDRETKISALIGGNFDDNKGNSMLGISYANRGAVFQRDRSFFSKAYTDPSVGGDFFPDIESLSGASALNGTFSLAELAAAGFDPNNCAHIQCFATTPYSQAALDSIFGPGVVQGFPALFNSFGGGIGINPAPNPANATPYFTGRGTNGVQGPGFINPGTTVGGAPLYKLVATNGFSGVTTNAVNQMLSLPLTRFSLFSNSHFDINDNVTMYLQGTFVEDETTTTLGSNPAVNQWGVFVPYDGVDGSGATTTVTDPLTGVTTTIASPHPVPAPFATLLNSRTGTVADPTMNATSSWEIGRGFDTVLGPRSQDQNFNTYQVLGGFKGKLPFLDWTYDIYGSHGNTAIQARYKGFVNLEQYQALIRLPNYGAGANFSVPNRGTFAHCTSGLNPFSSAPITQDCLDIINAPITTTTDVTQDVVEADFQGKLFDAPAGEVRAAFGADYRKDAFAYRPDPSMSQSNILGSTVGIFGANPAFGETTVTEGYGEVLIPILKDLPLVKSLSMNGGYRYSSYDKATVGAVNTWKITGDWALIDWLKVRGGYQVANRAPNTAELFQGGNTQVTLWPDFDPCITGQNAYGNTAANPHQAQVQLLCAQLSNPANPAAILPLFQGQFGVFSPFGLALDNQTGNPNLHSEDAKTWTLGAVITSPSQTPLLRRLSASIDYYNIGITDAIGVLTSQTVYSQCFNSNGTSNPSYDPNNFFCSLIVRSPTDGSQQTVKALFENLGGIKTSGIDVQLNWAAEFEDFALPIPGTVSIDFYFNHLNNYKTQTQKGQKFIDFADTSGDGTFTEGIAVPLFRDQETTTFGYALGPANVNLRWRHLPGVRSTTPGNLPAASYEEFDFFGTYRLTDTYTIRAGVENVFDKQPPITAAALANLATGTNATTGQGFTYNGSYDVLGRRFYIGLHAKY